MVTKLFEPSSWPPNILCAKILCSMCMVTWEDTCFLREEKLVIFWESESYFLKFEDKKETESIWSPKSLSRLPGQYNLSQNFLICVKHVYGYLREKSFFFIFWELESYFLRFEDEKETESNWPQKSLDFLFQAIALDFLDEFEINSIRLVQPLTSLDCQVIL